MFLIQVSNIYLVKSYLRNENFKKVSKMSTIINNIIKYTNNEKKKKCQRKSEKSKRIIRRPEASGTKVHIYITFRNRHLFIAPLKH